MTVERFHAFLLEHVFVNITDRNTGFDSPLISHFSPKDFAIVIDRCERMGVEIYGIEVFVNDIGFITCVIAPGDGYGWARHLVDEYRGRLDIAFSATYGEANNLPLPI